MKMCSKFRVENDDKKLVDVSFVGDNHEFGFEQTDDGTFFHLEGSVEILEVKP